MVGNLNFKKSSIYIFRFGIFFVLSIKLLANIVSFSMAITDFETLTNSLVMTPWPGPISKTRSFLVIFEEAISSVASSGYFMKF